MARWRGGEPGAGNWRAQWQARLGRFDQCGITVAQFHKSEGRVGLTILQMAPKPR